MIKNRILQLRFRSLCIERVRCKLIDNFGKDKHNYSAFLQGHDAATQNNGLYKFRTVGQAN